MLIENAGFGGTQAAPLAGLCIERYLKGRITRYDAPPAPHRPIAFPQALPPLHAVLQR
jgi:hypothetical protein